MLLCKFHGVGVLPNPDLICNADDKPRAKTDASRPRCAWWGGGAHIHYFFVETVTSYHTEYFVSCRMYGGALVRDWLIFSDNFVHWWEEPHPICHGYVRASLVGPLKNGRLLRGTRGSIVFRSV